jgi:hypothetical protein
MKRILFFLSILTAFSVSAQNKADSASKQAAATQVNIPGTRLFITPPTGFKLAKSFLGLEKDDRNYIEVFAPYGDNFSKATANFTRLTFEGKGMDVFTFKQFNMNGFTAKYAAMKGNTGLRKYDLVFGDTAFTVMVLGYCQLNDEETGKLIEKSILSVTYDRKMKLDPYAKEDFSINDSTSIYKFAKTTGTVYTYSLGGLPKTKYDEGNVFTVLTVTLDNPNGFDLNETMKAIYKDLGMTGIKNKKESTYKVDGLDATEVQTAAKEGNNKIMVYEFYVAREKKGVLMLGIARADFDKTMDEFMKLAHSIKFK